MPVRRLGPGDLGLIALKRETRFQSFFMLITDQPPVFASIINESESVPTLLSGRPPAGP
jgi:hypothetical protein